MNEIHEKETIQKMKKQLQHVRNYCTSLRLETILYGSEEDVLQVEDDVCAYLNYTKSIVHANQKKYFDKKDVVIEAMMRQQRYREQMKSRDVQAYVILQGINLLPLKQRELLFDIYVRQYDRFYIMKRAGGIVESTYHRQVNKAILNLAILLHQEVYQSSTLQSCK